MRRVRETRGSREEGGPRKEVFEVWNATSSRTSSGMRHRSTIVAVGNKEELTRKRESVSGQSDRWDGTKTGLGAEREEVYIGDE